MGRGSIERTYLFRTKVSKRPSLNRKGSIFSREKRKEDLRTLFIFFMIVAALWAIRLIYGKIE